ncbi:MAG: nitrogen regulation protein NR(II) [Paracoccaceae bacterium]
MSETDSFEFLWHSLPAPVLQIDPDGRIQTVNTAAESFFHASQRQLRGRPLARLTGRDSRATSLIELVLERGAKMAEYDVELTMPEAAPRLVDLHAAPLHQAPFGAVLMLHPRAIAESMDRSLGYRSAARSAAGLSALLAHEVKNPLAGIQGAAQLLEMNAADADRELTALIREEVARISDLLSRVEKFGEIGIGRRLPVNIHDVLDRAAKSARAGFASHVRFVEEYDPSLPPTWGDPDQLIQVVLNLLKNAAEAAPELGGVIQIRTDYRAGMTVATPSGRRESLPLRISITDNGPGIPEDLQRHIFDPFVSSKSTGSGLGLALVSKVVADHGGLITCDTEPGWTRFRISLPVATREQIAAAAADHATEDTEPCVPSDDPPQGARSRGSEAAA